MVWILNNKLKRDIELLNKLIIKYAPDKMKIDFILRNKLGFLSLMEMENTYVYTEALNEYINENLNELNNIRTLLTNSKNNYLVNDVRKLGYELLDVNKTTSETNKKELNDQNMSEEEYWKLADKLTNDFYSRVVKKSKVSKEFKLKILDKVFYSFSKRTYYLAKIIVYDKINKENLLNFVFYNVINRKKLYELSIQNNDKYGNSFMFHLHPTELPKIENILTKLEYEKLCKKINLNLITEEIQNMTFEDLKLILPMSMKYLGKTNPFIN